MITGQFYNGDIYTIFGPVNNRNNYKGEIEAGLYGVESLRFLSGNLPPGIKLYDTSIQRFTEGYGVGYSYPTRIGTYTFVMRAIAQPGYVNAKGESIVDVTFSYVVTNDD